MWIIPPVAPPMYAVGDKIIAVGFLSAGKLWVPEVRGLTVAGVTLCECESMPSYWRITADNGTEGAERFFARDMAQVGGVA